MKCVPVFQWFWTLVQLPAHTYLYAQTWTFVWWSQYLSSSGVCTNCRLWQFLWRAQELNNNLYGRQIGTWTRDFVRISVTANQMSILIPASCPQTVPRTLVVRNQQFPHETGNLCSRTYSPNSICPWIEYCTDWDVDALNTTVTKLLYVSLSLTPLCMQPLPVLYTVGVAAYARVPGLTLCESVDACPI